MRGHPCLGLAPTICWESELLRLALPTPSTLLPEPWCELLPQLLRAELTGAVPTHQLIGTVQGD